MKSIELKAAKETVSAYVQNNLLTQEVPFTTYGLLKNVINRPSQNGYSIEDMMQRLKVLGLVSAFKQFEISPEIKLEDISPEYYEQTATLELEDADYNALSNWVKEMRWNVLSNFIVEFVNNFKK